MRGASGWGVARGVGRMEWAMPRRWGGSGAGGAGSGAAAELARVSRSARTARACGAAAPDGGAGARPTSRNRDGRARCGSAGARARAARRAQPPGRRPQRRQTGRAPRPGLVGGDRPGAGTSPRAKPRSLPGWAEPGWEDRRAPPPALRCAAGVRRGRDPCLHRSPLAAAPRPPRAAGIRVRWGGAASLPRPPPSTLPRRAVAPRFGEPRPIWALSASPPAPWRRKSRPRRLRRRGYRQALPVAPRNAAAAPATARPAPRAAPRAALRAPPAPLPTAPSPPLAAAPPRSASRAWQLVKKAGRAAFLVGGALYIGTGVYAVGRQFSTFQEVGRGRGGGRGAAAWGRGMGLKPKSAWRACSGRQLQEPLAMLRLPPPAPTPSVRDAPRGLLFGGAGAALCC
jgi:hypothetical protein